MSSSATGNGSSPAGQDDTLGIGDVDNLGAVIGNLIDRIEELEARIDDLETDDRSARLERVIEHADRLSRGEPVVLQYNDVMAAAGVSAPTAYAYMDELAQNHDRVRERERPDLDISTRQITVAPPR